MASLREKEYEVGEEEEGEEEENNDELAEEGEELEEAPHPEVNRFSPVGTKSRCGGTPPLEVSRSINFGSDKRVGQDKSKESLALPPPKPGVTEIEMQLPGMGDGWHVVHVRLNPMVALQSDKSNWSGDVEKHRDSDYEVLQEEGEDDEVEEDERGQHKDINRLNEPSNGAEEGSDGVSSITEGLCPPWVLPLLSNDAFYWGYILDKMFGYVHPPGPNTGTYSNQKAGAGEEGAVGGESDDGARGMDRVVVSDHADKKSGASDEGSGTDDDELSAMGIPSKQLPTPLGAPSASPRPSLHSSFNFKLHMQKHVPKRPALRFTEVNRLFYIVRSINGRKWYLLDSLPVPVDHSERVTDNQDAREYGEEEEMEEEEEEGDVTESFSGTEVGGRNPDEGPDELRLTTNSGEGMVNEQAAPEKQAANDEKLSDETEEEDTGGVPDASMLDMNTVICVDTLTLAAIRCPTALRTCLTQKESVSLDCIEMWMRLDVDIALPILTTIHRTMLSVRAEASRLPYSLPDWKFDYNLFFTSSYLQHRKQQYPRQILNMVSSSSQSFTLTDSLCIGEKQSAETMNGLLTVCTFPSKPILLQNLNHVVGMRLLMWLLTEIPDHVLLDWSAPRPTPTNSGQKSTDSGTESDDDYNEGGDGEGSRRRGAARYVASIVDRFWKSAPNADGPYFIASPFLKAVVVEVRRRRYREHGGFGASKYTLMECVAHALPKRVEDGKANRDPLVASTFSLFPLGYGPVELSTPTPPNQRVYQSDLVMLLLALTTTPITRNVITLRSDRHSFGVRPIPHPLRHAPDGHHELLKHLLSKKAEKVRSPAEAMQSGYFRLLYLSLLRFAVPSSVLLLLSVTPLFSVVGPAERCPLPQLLHAWQIDWDMFCKGHLDHFIHTFWNELHYRVLERQFDEATMVRAKQLLLLEKATERRNQYLVAIRQLNSRARPLSAKTITGRPPSSQEGVETLALSSTLEALPPVNSRPIICNREHPISLSPYSEEWCHEEEHVRFMLASLPMAPRTYLTPETLHLLLFDVPCANRYAIYYLMRGCGVVLTQANPLRGVAVPAMEYALRTRNMPAVLVLLMIGETLDDQLMGGTINGEAWLYEAFRVRDAMKLVAVWRKVEHSRSSDPTVRFGVLRTLPTGK